MTLSFPQHQATPEAMPLLPRPLAEHPVFRALAPFLAYLPQPVALLFPPLLQLVCLVEIAE
jgi:hypothetical protein